MEVEYIKISDPQFKKVFDFPINELDYVLGGITITHNGASLGSTILYKNPHIKVPNDKALFFGFFKASNANVAKLLIAKIEEITVQNKLNKIIGPINGSTWYNYRLMDSHQNKPFLGEEITPLEYNEYLVSNDFKIFQSYASNIQDVSNFSEKKIEEKEQELKKNNWTMRSIDKNNLSHELFKIAQFSNISFSTNFLFSPIKEKDFIEKYTPLITSLNTEYVWLIENHVGELQALFLAYENALNKNELIFKTGARLPNCSIKGLGIYLTHKVTQQAKKNGIEKIIHAYLSNDKSTSISKLAFQAVVYRKYHLYYKAV